MPIRFAMSLTANGTELTRGDLLRVHRRVVRIGAAAAWSTAALFLLAGFSLGEPDLVLQATGPAIAAAVMTLQILVHREDGRVALWVSAAVIVVAHTAFGIEATQLAAALALVLVSSVSMLFVDRSPVSLGAAMGLLLLITPQLWMDRPMAALSLGAAMGIGFALVSMVLSTVVDAATAPVGRGGPALFEPPGSPRSRA